MVQQRLLGDRYLLDELVGSGGMAEVYRARDLRLNRIIAVKTLRSNLASDQVLLERFRREAQSAASLSGRARKFAGGGSGCQGVGLGFVVGVDAVQQVV
jgi:eukaryotic-like serine/threonine-protein kinase